MKDRLEYKTTTSRYVYNRLRKRILEDDGELHCARCRYHDNENRTGKYYGGCVRIGYIGGDYKNPIEYWSISNPNWKLVSKQKKQWMVKKVKREDFSWVRPSFDFVF